MAKVVTAVFASSRHGSLTVARLVEAGFSRADVSVLEPDAEPRPAHDRGGASHVAHGTRAGRAIGAVLGAITLGVTALGSLAVTDPPSSRPIVGALVGAGCCAGALVGSIVGFAISVLLSRTRHEPASHRVVVAVEASSDRIARAIAILRGEGSPEVCVL